MRLYNKLKKYSEKNILAMHMPGHKRKQILKNNLPYNIDITEIDGFDNLYHPTGILKECQEKLSKVYNSYKSYYLVNGGTSGILVSIRSFCGIGDKIIIAKNCHKAVFNSIELLNLKHEYIKTSFDENGICLDIKSDDLKKCLESNKDAKCVLITSPTYEGVISDIHSLASICHEYNIPLIVDEAHGAHLFLENKSALQKGADIVLNSLHKTLPSLTQTAVIHISSKAINRELLDKKMQRNISIFCSSSPSYILMSSIDECVEFIKKSGNRYYKRLKENLEVFKNKCKHLEHIKVINFNYVGKYFDFDNTKIVIILKNANITGHQLMQRLKRQNIQCEMAYLNYVICMTTICDSKKDILRLANVLCNIDKGLKFSNKKLEFEDVNQINTSTIYEAVNGKQTLINIDKSINFVSAEFVYAYPPGIPILIPGQVITSDIINHIKELIKEGIVLNSSSGEISKGLLYVLDNIQN